METSAEKISPNWNEPKSHFFPDGIPTKTRRKPQNTPALPNWFLGQGPIFEKLREDLRLSVSTPWNVLIVGESGTGKEVIAQYLHQERLKRNQHEIKSQPFVPLNCATIPDGLAESILFGHVKGAFTSARTKQIGKFEFAKNGTLFLDEIQSFPMALQSKLLRVIQTKEIEAVGGHKTIPIHCQIIAATNVPLELLVEHKKFRRDLYFRLNVSPLYLPPLRERLQDLPVLIKGILEDLRTKTTVKAHDVSSDVFELFLNHPWPGNIRELENTLLYSAMRSKETIDVQHLPASVTGELAVYLKKGMWDI